MGELMRQYWLPAILSSELPNADGAPIRVRLLGEDLVAFRDTSGTVGLIQANCPHRGAPMFFGRNEEGGLRCIYHGWKFDVGGVCTAMPNVPAESDFKEKVRTLAYRCVEKNGIVWVYMGQESTPPPVPSFDFGERSEGQFYFSKQLYECNWLQVMEGDFDPSHSSFLHAAVDSLIPPKAAPGAVRTFAQREQEVRMDDRAPLIMTVNTDYGLLVGARREAGPDWYWRLNLFAMPFYAFVPISFDAPIHCNAWIPVDDHTTIVLRMDYHLDRPLSDDEMARMMNGLGSTGAPGTYLPATSDAWGNWMPNLHRGNDYGIDRERQRTLKYSGMQGVWAEDKAVTEGMGAIIDRTQEQLGPSDVGIIQIRRMLMDSALALKEHGATPPGVTTWPTMVKSCVVFLPKEMSWEQVADALISGKLERTAAPGT
jgi:nitrite reductase/ring-hydroxylating ferredoxin subunit